MSLKTFSDVFKERTLSGTFEGVLTTVPMLALLISFYPLGVSFSLVNFTYGAKGLDPSAKAALPALCFGMLVLMIGWEVFFRGLILRFLLKRFDWKKALLFHMIAINLVIIPLLGPKAIGWRDFGIIRFFIGENLFECFLALFFMRTGSIIGNTFLHTVCNCIRFFIINDAVGPFETLYFYSAASDDFYWLILASTFLTASIQAFINQKWGMREVRAIQS